MAVASSLKTTDRRPLYGLGALAAAGFALVSILAVFFIFLSPGSPDGAVAPVAAGHVSDLSPHQPVYSTKGDLWLVRLDENEVIAIVPRDTHNGWPNSTCTDAELARGPSVTPRFNPQIVFWDTDVPWNGMTGVFRAYCTASRFDYAGNRLYGPSPRALDRYPVRIDSSGFITVFPREDLIIKGPRQVDTRP